MTETQENFPDPYMPTIFPYTGVKSPNTVVDMTYLEKNNIDKAIFQKLRKKYVYETDMCKI